jgi:Mg-chelatase subunit ChlD
MQTGEVQANVVITDGNLGSSIGSGDARQITERIKTMGLPVRVVGLASDPMSEFGITVDVELTKHKLKPGQLNRIIDDLPEPDQP